MSGFMGTRWHLIPPLLYLLGSIGIASFLVATGSYIQYHWDVRMDHIRLFLGLESPSERAVNALFIALWALAVSLVATYVATHRPRYWKSQLAIVVGIGTLVALYPLVATLLIVWPAILIELTLSALGTSPNYLETVGIFTLVIATHGSLVWLAYRLKGYTPGSTIGN